jgi:hypothetical protein
MKTGEIYAAAQDGCRLLRANVTRIWRALLRFNSIGIGAIDPAHPRAARAKAFRNALAEKYRGSSPCC